LIFSNFSHFSRLLPDSSQAVLSGNFCSPSLRQVLHHAAFRLLLCTICLFATSGVLRAQPQIDGLEQIQIPTDFSRVEFYLVTVNVGNNVWDNFGHTALRMIDDSTATDLLFNWGLFDTSVGYTRFATNFALGIMNYQLGVSPPAWEFGRYEREGRTVWQDRLRLSNSQKQILYQRLAWNIRPENIVYAYDYFYDNCTTRVRDYLDEALSGLLSTNSQAMSSRTFRDEVQDHYASVPFIAFSLDVLMNERIDQRMTQWQRMFLPLQLREQLRQQGLLDEPQTLVEFAPPQRGMSFYLISALLIVPVLILLFSVRKASIASFASQPGFTLLAPGLSYRVLGLIGVLVALFSGSYGLVMSLGWWLSSHQDIHGNLNLLLFWPTDLLGLGIALNWLIKGDAYRVSSGRLQLMVTYLVLHLLAALAYLIMQVFGISAQHGTSILLYVLPLLMLFTLLVMTAGIRPVRSIRWS
jgi:hypothetical protein